MDRQLTSKRTPTLPVFCVGTLSLALALCGCRPNDPGTLCGIDIADTLADVLVLDSGSTVRFEVALFAISEDAQIDAPIPRELCSSDSLTVNGTSAFLRAGPNGQPSYVINLERASPQYTLVYDHGGSSTTFVIDVNVPAFEVTSPNAGDEVPRSQDLTVSWSPAASEREEPVVVVLDDEIDGIECLQAIDPLLVPDVGEATIPADLVKVFDGVEPEFSCAAQLSVARLESTELVARGGATGLHPDSGVLALTLRTIEVISTGSAEPDTGP